MKKEVEIFDDENSIVINDEHTTNTFEFFPSEKKIKIDVSINDDYHHNYSTIEYKISDDPIDLKMRTIELYHDFVGGTDHSIKDGVVLESEIKKKDFVMPDRIESLKKEVVWSKVPIFGNYEVNLYILSKHPEIISKDEYRRFLRQSIERIKDGVAKVKELVKKDSHGLEIHTGDYGMSIWYPDNESEKKESEAYWDLPKEKRDDSAYGKKLKYVEDFNKSLFDEKSSSYVGISEIEFKSSDEIVEYIQKLLDKKDEPTKKEVEPKISKTKGFVISLLLTLLLSWVVSWFVDINPFLIFVIVQVIAFAQSIVGGWLGKFFE
ncbi:hypothetical protein H6790_02420 [Candidatus Nomurabacteria bacterium]|nr:hypothetical protein [Candidatus Nomurabacteria bacterium]